MYWKQVIVVHNLTRLDVVTFRFLNWEQFQFTSNTKDNDLGPYNPSMHFQEPFKTEGHCLRKFFHEGVCTEYNYVLACPIRGSHQSHLGYNNILCLPIQRRTLIRKRNCKTHVFQLKPHNQEETNFCQMTKETLQCLS